MQNKNMYNQNNNNRLSQYSCELSSWHGTRSNPNSIHEISYNTRLLPTTEYSLVSLRTLNFNNQIPNIVDWSAYSSLQNDQFTWEDNSVSYTVTIPESMYDGPTLGETLTTLMNDSASPATYLVTFDIISSKFLFTTTVGPLLLDFTVDTSPWYELGFVEGASPTGATQIISTVVAHLDGSHAYFIRCPALAGDMVINYNGGGYQWIVPIHSASTFRETNSFEISGYVKFLSQENKTIPGPMVIYLYFERAGTIHPLVLDINSAYFANFTFFGSRNW